MPYNGSGGTTQPGGGGFPAVPSTLIESAKVNISIADIYTMLASVIVKDGQTTTTQRIPFASGISTDTISEKTSATGVTIDGVLLQDGRIDTTQGADIVCAATINLETATGNVVDVTGSTGPVTAITLSQGHWRIVRFTGTPTLTNGASLVLPGAANIIAAAGDYALFVGYAAGVVRCESYQIAAVAPFDRRAPGAIGGTTPAAIAATTVTGTIGTLTGLLDISGASAGQIKFPATQNASADANTLDDYEEGTWTPGISFGGLVVGITYSGQQGRYTKIGRTVFLDYAVSLSSKGSSVGAARLTGLPFTALATPGSFGAPKWFQMTSTLVAMMVEAEAAATALIWGATGATASLTLLSNTDFNNAAAISGSLVIHV